MGQRQLQLFFRFYELIDFLSADGYPQCDVSSNRIWKMALSNFFAIAEVLSVGEDDITDKKVYWNYGEEWYEIFGLEEDGIDYSWAIEGDFEQMHFKLYKG